MTQAHHIRRFRISLAIFIAALLVSGIAAFPLQTEPGLLNSFLRSSRIRPITDHIHLLLWIDRVQNGLRATNAQYPFLAYGTDWLASAHLVIAVLSIGPFIDPVRNMWVVTFGLIACAGALPLALIAGPLRDIPLPWRLVDCSFGIFGSIPLLNCMRSIRSLEHGTR